MRKLASKFASRSSGGVTELDFAQERKNPVRIDGWRIAPKGVHRATQVFAYGENTRALRLVCKHPDLRAG